MPFRVIYKPLAQIEVAQAYAWYAQPEINMGDAFLTELERIDNFWLIHRSFIRALKAIFIVQT
jgi:hypothetical protein